jgi:hypothetical protein
MGCVFGSGSDSLSPCPCPLDWALLGHPANAINTISHLTKKTRQRSCLLPSPQGPAAIARGRPHFFEAPPSVRPSGPEFQSTPRSADGGGKSDVPAYFFCDFLRFSGFIFNSGFNHSSAHRRQALGAGYMYLRPPAPSYSNPQPHVDCACVVQSAVYRIDIARRMCDVQYGTMHSIGGVASPLAASH